MFGTIRRHQQWLWLVIVSAMIVSFVLFFSPNQGSYGTVFSGGGGLGTLDGKPITKDMWRTAEHQAQMQQYLTSRSRNAAPNEQEIARQLLLDAKIKELNIQVGTEPVNAWLRQQLRNPQTGQVNLDPVLQDLQAAGFSEADFQDFIRHDIARRHLAELASVSGKLITPRDAEAEFRRENEQALVSLVQIPTSNFLANVKLDPAAIQQFYSNRVATYRIPPRVQLSFVRFSATNFVALAESELAQIADLTNRMEAEYTRRGAEAFRDADGKPLTHEAALEGIRSQTRDSLALRAARGKAIEFYNELSKMEPLKAENLDSLAVSKEVPAEVTEPFPQYGAPRGFEDVRGLAQEAANLNQEVPFTTPQASETAVYIFALKRQIPSEIPPLEQVRARVTEDYRRTQASDALRAMGQSFSALVTNGLTEGKSFATIAAEQGHKVLDLPPLAVKATTLEGYEGRLDLGAVKNAAFALKPGTASDFISTRDGGMIVFLNERRPVEETRVKEQLPKFLEDLRRQNALAGFGEWFNREFERSGLARLISRQTGAQPQ